MERCPGCTHALSNYCQKELTSAAQGVVSTGEISDAARKLFDDMKIFGCTLPLDSVQINVETIVEKVTSKQG